MLGFSLAKARRQQQQGYQLHIVRTPVIAGMLDNSKDASKNRETIKQVTAEC
jgi:hypothetical protein